jgi:G:T-mismatch repair DNA endonuclease (very short patch repair protein)
LPDDDEEEDEYSDEEEGTSNRSNAALTVKSRRRNVATTERQTFQLSQCGWEFLAVWKKLTDQTLIHMQIVVFAVNRY